jgi:hypothetical protein
LNLIENEKRLAKIWPAVVVLRMFVYTDVRWDCDEVSIGVVVAPGPVFVLLFFLRFRVVVILAMFFGEETAPSGLFVIIPLAVITVFLSSGGRRLGEKSGAERGSQCCGKQNRGEMLLGFLHSGSSEGMKTESAGRGLYGKFRRVRVEFVYGERE